MSNIKTLKKLSFALCVLLFVGCQGKLNHIVVQEGNKEGIINEEGEVLVKPIYNEITNFNSANEKIHPNYVNLHWLENEKKLSYAIIQNSDGKYGIINKDGYFLLKPIYESISNFFNTYAKIKYGNKYGLIDEDFNIVLKPVFDEVHDFVNGTAIIQNNGKFGCITSDMKLKIKASYDNIYFKSENISRIYLKNKWGYLDNNCNVLVKPMYDYAYD